MNAWRMDLSRFTTLHSILVKSTRIDMYNAITAEYHLHSILVKSTHESVSHAI